MVAAVLLKDAANIRGFWVKCAEDKLARLAFLAIDGF
jgi:hypothetical protein